MFDLSSRPDLSVRILTMNIILNHQENKLDTKLYLNLYKKIHILNLYLILQDMNLSICYVYSNLFLIDEWML